MTERAFHEQSLGDYFDRLSSSDPTPGGGSVTGVVAALAMALGRMVISLSDPDPALEAAELELRRALTSSLTGSEADESAYGGYVQATRLPKATAEEKSARRLAMQEALTLAAQVPLGLAELVASMKPVLAQVQELGNPHVTSDAEIALILADAAIASSLVNVRVNLPLIKDQEVVAELEGRLNQMVASF